MKKLLAVLIVLVSSLIPLSGQSEGKAEPVFPDSVGGLVYLEGEDAVSTNFAKEPTLDYSSSGLRLLNLNQDPQSAGAPFFAEYAFVVDEAGDYEFWIGGTPPGPRDLLSPSYISPLRYQLDGGPATAVYREDVQVVENYSVTNFWSVLKTRLTLKPGVHTLRLEVAEKRRYDNRYYFHLDALFFLKTGSGDLSGASLPAKFPADRATRKIDNPYRTIAESETLIQQNPKQLGGYLDLAKIYSLVSDYQNALKVLNRARINIGDDPQISLLQAKNRIWSSEYEEGLKLYREYLAANPQDLAVWAEAAKVVAWMGQYQASLDLYRDAIKAFPEDLNLMVNNGVTMLWANRIQEGEAELAKAWTTASQDAQTIKLLGTIYLVNGYPQKTVDTYEKGIKLFPTSLELMLLLQDVAMRQGQIELAQNTAERIQSSFAPSDRLNIYLQTATLKAGIKQDMLNAYQVRLKATPDDIKLRDELAKAYFWNGRREEAVQESQNILVNMFYRHFQGLDREFLPEYQTLDASHFMMAWLVAVQPQLKSHTSALQKAYDAWKALSAQVADLTKSGKTPDKLVEAQANLVAAAQSLADAIGVASQFSQQVNRGLDQVAGLVGGAKATAQKAAEENLALAKRQPWHWDRTNTLIELADSASRGNQLATYLLARISLYEQSFKPAQAYLNQLDKTENAPASFGWLARQAGIWTGASPDLSTAGKATYYPYGDDLVSLQASFDALPPAAPGVVGENTAADALQLMADLNQQAKLADDSRPGLETAVRQVHQRLLSRMQLQFYQYDSDTADLRSQLGDYYLSLARYPQARIQLERVLLITPGNVGAKFNLARACQLSGDWSTAMRLYKEVYQIDPKFENTANLYNQLAGLHAGRIVTNVLSFWDNARTSTKARIELQTSGTSALGFNAAYSVDTIRLIKAVDQNDPITINLHSLELKIPVSIPDTGLTIFAKLGGTAKNKYFSDYFAADSTPEMQKFFNNFTVSPLVGAGLGWVIGPLNLQGSYTFDQIQDSQFPMHTSLLEDLSDASGNMFPLRTTSFEHLGELTAGLFFSLPDSLFLQSISSRTYGKLASVFSPFEPTTNKLYQGVAPQTNLLYSGVEELNFNLLLAKDPWTILVPSLKISWEDSTNPAETAFYAPNAVLNFRGGMQLSSWIGMGDGWVLGLSLAAGAGVHDSPANTPVRSLFQFDGLFRTEISRKDVALYLSVSGSRSSADLVESYWSLNLNVGLNISMPDYIVP